MRPDVFRANLVRATLLAASIGAMLGPNVAPAAAQTRTKVTAYTAMENDQLSLFKSRIEAAIPDIDVVFVRESTGVITSRFLAEKDNPRADVILGLAATSLLLFEKANLLETYEPKGAQAIKANFRDTKAPYTWTGMDAFIAVACYNTIEGARANAVRPKVWNDLTAPQYKGRVVMPHPVSSGTGYLMVAAWLQTMGEEKAWAFMDKLHNNIAVYTHSGSAPCVQAAKGEHILGTGYDMRGAREKTNGAPIELIVPEDGAGWDMEASGIVKGTKNLELAKKLTDWVASEDANKLYGQYYALVAHPNVRTPPPNYPLDAEAKMVKNDFGWMADNRDRVLAEWSKRYESKAQPK